MYTTRTSIHKYTAYMRRAAGMISPRIITHMGMQPCREERERDRPCMYYMSACLYAWTSAVLTVADDRLDMLVGICTYYVRTHTSIQILEPRYEKDVGIRSNQIDGGGGGGCGQPCMVYIRMYGCCPKPIFIWRMRAVLCLLMIRTYLSYKPSKW